MPPPPDLPQYSAAKVLLIWAAAAVPMPVLAFWGAPRLAPLTNVPLPLMIWIVLIAGMAWQFVLSLILLAPEAAAARHTGWAPRLWLRLPQAEGDSRPSARPLWWLLPIIALGVLIEQTVLADWLAWPLRHLIPALEQVPAPRLEELASLGMEGKWWILGLGLLSCLFNYALGEELLFRGVLLPRMRGAFGRWDWLANALLFGAYHLIRPLTIPAIMLSSMLWTYPARRWRSIWFALIPHGLEGVFMLGMITAGVLGAFATGLPAP